MRIYRGLDNLHIACPVATLGSFDGVHLGHVKVLEGLKAYAREIGGETVIITFDPHPREVLYPMEKRPGILTTLEEKTEILAAYGIDHLIVIPFTGEFAAMPYDDFVRHILVDKIGLKALVVGYDHRFGKNREGNYDVLKELSRKYGFYVKREEVYSENDINVSSTKIRTALEIGDIATVNCLLGYAYKISGKVVHGDKIGRTIGFPTANIEVDDSRKQFPANGVYAVKVKLGEKEYKGMMNIGFRPTVSTSGEKRPEVHIFDFQEDIYGQHLELLLVSRIRGERKFDSKSELQLQLQSDMEQAEKVLQNVSP